MAFHSIRDQKVPVRLLRSVIQRNRIPNGLLFWGPSGVGKRFTALEMAKAINCEQHTGDACDNCLACRKVEHGSHPDVKELIPSGKTRIIKVEAIDALVELASYRPYEGGYRVVIFNDADRIHVSAQNKFLKTLEEPPSATLFILLTEYPSQLLPTIRSRCQNVRFSALRRETVAELLLAHQDIRPDRAKALASISQGQMSRAFDLVESPKREIVLDAAIRLGKGDDPLLLSDDFVKKVKATGDALRAQLEAELNQEEQRELSKEDREEAEEEREAYILGMIRRDLMEFLFLLGTWYRDEIVQSLTDASGCIWNNDQAVHLGAARFPQGIEKLKAIEQAWVYIERNLKMERVFRDLFFTLAA